MNKTIRKNSAITAVIACLSLIASGCGMTETNTDTIPVVSETVTEVTEENTDIAETTKETETSETDTVLETTETNDENEIPPIVSAVLSDDSWMKKMDENFDQSFCEYHFWFQDIDFDGSPEFIADNGVFGAHGARGFIIYTLKDGRLEPIKNQNDDENSVMFWFNDSGENYIDLNDTGFIYYPYKTQDGGYIYISPLIDGVYNQTDYTIKRLDMENGIISETMIAAVAKKYNDPDGNGYKFLFEPQWDNDLCEYVSTKTENDFISDYTDYFSSLTLCSCDADYICYGRKYFTEDYETASEMIYPLLSDDEKLDELMKSYSCALNEPYELNNGFLPLRGVMNEIKSSAYDNGFTLSYDTPEENGYNFNFSYKGKDLTDLIYGYDPVLNKEDRTILGYDCFSVKSYYMDLPQYCIYLTAINDEPIVLLSTFNSDGNIYEADVDGDGENEVIANCMYGGDGVMVTSVYKIIDGKTYCEEVSYGKLFKDFEFGGALRPDVSFDAETMSFVSHFNPNAPDDFSELYYCPVSEFEFEFIPFEP